MSRRSIASRETAINQNQESIIFFEGVIPYDASREGPSLMLVYPRVLCSRELFMKIVIFLRFYPHFATLSAESYTPGIARKLVSEDKDPYIKITVL